MGWTIGGSRPNKG